MANDKDFIVKNAVEVGGSTKVTLGTITSSDIDLSTGNYFSDTLAANTTYTISNAGDVQSFQVEVTGGGVGYDLSVGVYDSVSFSVSAQDSFPIGISFNNDGTKLYVVGDTNDTIYQYSLSTAFDLSTASYDSVSFSVSEDTSPRSMSFNVDGTKMYISGGTNSNIYQYSLSTAFDLSTASYDSVSFSVSSQTIIPSGMHLKPDGTKMYVASASNDAIYQYSMSTAFDLSTASYDSVSFSIASQETTVIGLSFSSDGTKMYVVGISSDSVHQYSLSTAFDLSTASYDNINLSVATQDTTPNDVTFNSEGTKMYVVGRSADAVFQYSTAIDATLTWPSSIEWAGGVAPAAPATGETDLFTITTDDGGTTYTGVKTADNLS